MIPNPSGSESWLGWATTVARVLTDFMSETRAIYHRQGQILRVGSFLVANLPPATTPGRVIYVSNETGGATLAFSDGTNWRRVQDRAVVS